jgi:hypothetical protein
MLRLPPTTGRSKRCRRKPTCCNDLSVGRRVDHQRRLKSHRVNQVDANRGVVWGGAVRRGEERGVLVQSEDLVRTGVRRCVRDLGVAEHGRSRACTFWGTLASRFVAPLVLTNANPISRYQ